MKKLITLLSVILLFAFSSCEEPGITKRTITPKIGVEYEGGIVFHIFEEGENGYVEGEIHGLIYADTTLGMFIWGCQNAPLVSFNESGEWNTDVIVEHCPGENAAYECILTSLNGYWDWWLPSLEEFQLLSETLIVDRSEYYWTSTKHSYFNAYAIRPINGAVINAQVVIEYNVLPIRKF